MTDYLNNSDPTLFASYNAKFSDNRDYIDAFNIANKSIGIAQHVSSLQRHHTKSWLLVVEGARRVAASLVTELSKWENSNNILVQRLQELGDLVCTAAKELSFEG